MQKQNLFTKVFFFIILSLLIKNTNAQTGLNFQGVARNANNVILASQSISLRLSILQGSATGNAEYTEVRKVNTNTQGLFTAVIGDTGAISTLGNFASINWKSNPKFLKIEMDAAAGNNFITMGTTQFQSVAYAQFANSVDAENIAGIVPVARGGTGTGSLAALKTALAIDKTTVGLPNVDNTTDLLKPISTATKTALDLKENQANKSSDINLGGLDASDSYYPTQKAVKSYVAANATSGGVADGGITNIKIADLAVTDEKLATGISKSKVGLGNVENIALSTWAGNSSITSVGTITSGIWNGTPVAIANGGTNSAAIPTAGGIGFGTGTAHAYTSAGTAGQILSSNGTFDPIWVTPNTISVPYTGATSAVDLGAFDLKVNNLTIGLGGGSIPTNTVLGAYALNANTTGSNNVANGNNALLNNLSGSYNTAIGNNSLITNITGSRNTVIGNDANVASDGLTNATAIGAGAIVNTDNTIQLGSIGVRNVVTSGTMSATAYTGAWGGDIIDIAHGGTGTSTANYVDLSTAQNIVGAKTFLTDANINGLTVGKGAGNIASNTTLGRNALSLNTSGFDNTAIGLFSLYSNLDGISNTAIGRYSLYANTNGKFNTGIGTNALSSNLDGEFNSSLGALTLNGNTSGKFNTAIGYSALQLNSTAEGNTATGAVALNSNTTGENNTATGAYALNSNITGYDNTAIGYSSLVSLTSGDDNTSIGSGADVSVGNLTNATAIGAFAIVKASNTIQLGNTFVENVVTSGTISATGFVSATGYGTASGTSAQFLKADGSIDGTPYVNKNNSTIAIGNEAGYVSQGTSAIAMGEYTGYSDQSPNAIAIGTNAGLTSQGVTSIGIGMYAGKTSQGHKAIAIGLFSGQTSQGISAIAIGEEAGKTNQQSSAIGIGYIAGRTNQGDASIGIGANAGSTNQGYRSIAIGLNAGNDAQGANSIAIGTSAGIYSQTANSIILNATGSDLNASTTGFFVAPIRLSTPTSPVYYDLATKEITYGTEIDAGTLTGTTAVANGGTGLTSAGPTGNVLTSNGTDWVSAPIISSVDLTTAQTVSGSKSFTSNMRVGTATPTSSAVLEVSSTTQGFLPPRMTLTQRDAISSPAIGLMIFCTNCTPKGDPEYYNGTRWTSMLSAAPLANTIIGDQVWSSTNLNVGKYRNGDVIPQVTGTAWAGLTTGAWCWYNDDSVTYAATYGKLYNWHAVNDPRGLAPLGWHIPTIAEWTILTDYLGGTTIAGGAMKQTGTSLWTTPNTGATNTSGFVALPGGVRNASNFDELGNYGHWWSTSAVGSSHASAPYLYFSTANSYANNLVMNSGLSVRCVRD